MRVNAIIRTGAHPMLGGILGLGVLFGGGHGDLGTTISPSSPELLLKCPPPNTANCHLNEA